MYVLIHVQFVCEFECVCALHNHHLLLPLTAAEIWRGEETVVTQQDSIWVSYIKANLLELIFHERFSQQLFRSLQAPDQVLVQDRGQVRVICISWLIDD